MNKNKLADLKHIRSMLAGASQDDKAVCDEISARVWCFINDHTFVGIPHTDFNYLYEGQIRTSMSLDRVTKYTHDLNALRDIQGEGWVLTWLCVKKGEGHCDLTYGYPDNGHQVTSEFPTLEFAWLDAILQTQIWEIENED